MFFELCMLGINMRYIYRMLKLLVVKLIQFILVVHLLQYTNFHPKTFGLVPEILGCLKLEHFESLRVLNGRNSKREEYFVLLIYLEMF